MIMALHNFLFYAVKNACLYHSSLYSFCNLFIEARQVVYSLFYPGPLVLNMSSVHQIIQARFPRYLKLKRFLPDSK